MRTSKGEGHRLSLKMHAYTPLVISEPIKLFLLKTDRQNTI